MGIVGGGSEGDGEMAGQARHDGKGQGPEEREEVVRWQVKLAMMEGGQGPEEREDVVRWQVRPVMMERVKPAMTGGGHKSDWGRTRSSVRGPGRGNVKNFFTLMQRIGQDLHLYSVTHGESPPLKGEQDQREKR